MTLQAVNHVVVPEPAILHAYLGGSTTIANVLIDAAAEKVAMIFRAPKAGSLARVGFRTNTVTTGDTLKVSFQDVSLATGDPDGVVDQFRTVAVADTDDNAWIRTGLITGDGTDGGTLRSVSRGDLIAVVIEFNSYVAGNLNIGAMVSLPSARGAWLHNAYVDHFTAAWAKLNANTPILAVEYSDGSFGYVPGIYPMFTPANTAYGSGSSPNECGLKFRMPVPIRVAGFWLAGGATNATADFDVVLYDSDGSSVLASKSFDGNVAAQNASSQGLAELFNASVSLLKNTFYRLVLKPTTANQDSLWNATFSAAHGNALLDQLSGGQDFHWTQRAAGVWTDTTTRRPAMGLLVDGLDDGVVAGGVSRARIVNHGGQ